MTKKTLKISLALALAVMMSAPACFAATSTKSFNLSVTIPERVGIPESDVQPLNVDEALSKFTVKEYSIRFLEITEIVQRDEPVVMRSIVAL